ADYFGVDATLIRLAYVLLSVFTVAFPGIIVYILAAIIIPSDPGYTDV
ncbi:MAG: PspC domain-containing protein, partial [Clostridia bacterium]|nr:PspC domain-containing protein [Clostridia bacterium]